MINSASNGVGDFEGGNMLKVISILLLVSQTVYGSTDAPEILTAKQRCQITSAGESLLYSTEFENPKKHNGSSWFFTFDEMAEQFKTTYNSGKRLPKRAYYDNQTNKFFLPIVDGKKIETVEITENFILSVQKHIENSLKLKYAEFAFFPDMGHSHLYFPQEHWDKEYSNYLEQHGKAAMYQKMLGDEKMHALYHTAEKLLTQDENKDLIADPHLEFRYWNRNVVGTNVQSDELKIYISEEALATPPKYNTVGNLEGYGSWSAGYNLHSSKDGCFSYQYKGDTYYFDLSLYDLERDPDAPWAEGDF
jgi:predicted DNA-binding protein (MmcQ/YjbR family)